MQLKLRSRLIITSTLLIAFVVVCFALITNTLVEGDLANEQERISDRRLQAMRESGLLLGQLTAQGALPLLAENQIPNLTSLIRRVVNESEESGVEVLAATILDERGRPLTSAPEDASPPSIGREELDAIEAPMLRTEASEQGFVVIAPAQSGQLRLGYVVLSFGDGPLREELAELERNTAQRIATVQRNNLILGGLALLLGMLIAVWQSLRITNPIQRLASSAEKIASGELDTRAEVRSQDEIGQLSKSFNNMAERVQQLLKETAEKATL
ncbi:MAG: HAMP domain-containing protein, partial [Myxococcales bacterium]|nr:HAMP domain-containing protein [Myxococcales bacterium]